MPEPMNRRSRIITQGIQRSPNRAMLRAVGLTDADFDKPTAAKYSQLVGGASKGAVTG